MPKIIDPDFLNQGTEVVINPTAKTIQLLVAGNLDDNPPGKSSGVTGQALYSFLKEEWKTDPTLNRYRFPIQMIYEASFILINGWTFADQQTIDLIRDAGFKISSTGAEYACVISLGNMDDPAADLAYYQQIQGFNQTTSVFDKTGELNENIQIFDGSTNDYRNFLKVFLREYSKDYAQYNLLNEQGLTALTYQAYRLPLSNSIDLKIQDTDTVVDTTAPYTSMSINFLRGTGFTTFADATTYPAGSVVQDSTGRWFFTPAGGTSSTAGGTTVASDTGITDWESYAGEIQIGSNWYAFNVIVDGANGTAEQIHTFCQRQLRNTSDINANTLGGVNQSGYGVVNGNVCKPLTYFVGDELNTYGGIAIINFNANDTNRLRLWDITVDGDTNGDGNSLDNEDSPETTNGRVYPFVAAGTLLFSQNLVDEIDANTFYTMYFQYITRTTDSTIAVGTPTGNTADITWTGTALDHIVAGDYIVTSGFTNAGNNGVWLVNSVAAGTLNATKQDGVAPVAEAAGATVTVDENPFETPGAVIVNDNSGNPIGGPTAQITASSVPWNFDYDNNNQGGRTPGTDAPVIVVAEAFSTAQWISVTHTITRSTGQNISVNSVDELNYNNP